VTADDVTALTERSTEQAARARAERIRKGLRDYLETVAEFALAFERADWQVLGYPTWQDYLDGEYGADRLRVPEIHRTQAVATLRQVGMSTRAIGSALGISKDTAAREVAAVAAETDDLPATVRSLDGRERPATRPAPAAQVPAVVVRPIPGPDEQVWIATARKGIEAHAPKTKTFTRCGRSTRTGLTLPADQAHQRHAATWCRTCWPEEPTRFAAGESEAHDPRDSDSTAGAERRDSAPATQPDPLAGVGADYEPDPAARIAAVAAVAPEYVRPVEQHTQTATGTNLTSSPVDGADVDGVAPETPARADGGPVDHAAPAPVPPAAASPAAGGTGVTPTPLTLAQIGRIRAALAHLDATGGRLEPRVYEVWYSSAAPALSGPEPVRVATVQWWPDGTLHLRFLTYAGRYCKASTELYAEDVDEAIDILCALRILPAHLSTAHTAGVLAGMRAGDAIDGSMEEADRG
jgi:hypothetical protein